MLLVTARSGSVDDPAARRGGDGAHRACRPTKPGVEQAPSRTGALGSPPPLRRATDGRQAMVLARPAGGRRPGARRGEADLAPDTRARRGPITVRRRRSRRGLPPGRHADRARPHCAPRSIALPDHAAPADARVRQRRRRRAPAGRRRDRRSSGPSSCCDPARSLTDVSIFALNLTTGDGARPRDRLQPVHRLALPRGAARGLDPHDAVVRTVQTAGQDGRASARSPSRCRSPRCSCSRSPSCGRSRTPASRSSRIAGLGAVVMPAGAAGGARTDGSTAGVLLRRATPKPVGEGVLAPHRHRGDAPAAADRRRRDRVPAPPRPAVPADRVRPARRPGAAARARPRRQVQDDIRASFSSNETIAALGRRARRRRRRRPHRRDRSVRGRALQIDGVARVDALTGSYVEGRQVAGPGPITARFVARRRHLAVGRPVVEPQSHAGEQLVHDVRDRSGAVPGAGRRAVGPARRHEGVAVRPAAAGRSGSSRSRPSCCCS